MLSKEEFLKQAGAAYDEWVSQNPDSKSAYNYEKDFEAWLLSLGRGFLEGNAEGRALKRNEKKNSEPFRLD